LDRAEICMDTTPKVQVTKTKIGKEDYTTLKCICIVKQSTE
jgi:hypothetical protein